jgi:serine protease AprX
MRRSLFGLIIFIALLYSKASVCEEPSNVYFIQFKDRAGSTYNIEHPLVFLSAKAVERREKNGIAIVENDKPLNSIYVQQVALYTDSIIHRLKWFNGVTAIISTNAQVNALRTLPFVKDVQQLNITPIAAKDAWKKLETEYTEIENQPASEYGAGENQVTMISADSLHNKGFKGNGVIIAVFDNGFNHVNSIDAFQHLLADKKILYTYDYVKRQKDVYNVGDHGTAVLSTMAAVRPYKMIGTAPEANFLLFATENNQDENILEEYNWAEAAEKADSIGADVFTTSLGYTEFSPSFGNHIYEDLTGNKTVITQAANIAFSKGIIVLNSAGNEGEKPWHYISAPADGKDVIAVGAVDKDGAIAKFSSRGPNASQQIKPDLDAQGAGVSVIDLNGNLFNSNGTSFSCPILAGGVACLVQAFKDSSATKIKEVLMQSAHMFKRPDNDYGYGIPNLYNAFLLLKEDNSSLIANTTESIIYPNPFTSTPTLLLKQEGTGITNVSIYNYLGQKVWGNEYNMRYNAIEIISLDGTESLQAGNYIVYIRQGDKKKVIRIFRR